MRSNLTPRQKAAILAILTVLCAGTTISSGIYPGAALLVFLLSPPESGGIRPSWLSAKRLGLLAISVGILVLLGTAAAVPFLPEFGEWLMHFKNHVLVWLHLRIYHQPGLTVCDWAMGSIYPVTSPYPVIQSGQLLFGHGFAGTWTWLHILAATAWCGLLSMGLVNGLRDKSTRWFTLGLAAWVGFNLALHSVWGGPEPFLYSPHWSWALLVIALMAARGAKSAVFVAVCIPIGLAQILTIRWLVLAIAAYQP